MIFEEALTESDENLDAANLEDSLAEITDSDEDELSEFEELTDLSAESSADEFFLEEALTESDENLDATNSEDSLAETTEYSNEDKPGEFEELTDLSAESSADELFLEEALTESDENLDAANSEDALAETTNSEELTDLSAQSSADELFLEEALTESSF